MDVTLLNTTTRARTTAQYLDAAHVVENLVSRLHGFFSTRVALLELQPAVPAHHRPLLHPLLFRKRVRKTHIIRGVTRV